MVKRKIIAGINDNNITIDEAKEKLKEAIKQWEEVKQKGTEMREKEILDLYPVELR